MCQNLIFRGQYIQTLGEIRRVMPILVKDRNYSLIPNGKNICLCTLDLKATVEANGFKAVETGDGDIKVVEENS